MENRPVDLGSIQGSHRPISFIRIKHRTRANDILCKCLMYHAACKVEFQPFTRSYSQLTFPTFYKIILRSIEKRLLLARPIGGWNSTLRAAYSIIRLYRAHAINRSFSPFFSAQTFAPILYVRTRTDCCLLLFLNMSSYEYYWCCWCCCTYRVVPYDPSSVLATAAVVNRRSISLPRCIAPSSYLSPSPCV